ncbi:MAG: aminopeptidase [Oscillospiraceae bacterium]|jgi:aspartyl aminopeptidase|nr:aminopeptidase [Oscillospiraceae bacterium]
MDKEKSPRKDRLFYEQKNGHLLIDKKEAARVESYCKGYMDFLDAARTEREAVREGIRLAEAKGFVPYKAGMKIAPGMKLYHANRGKALLLAVIGTKPLSEGSVIAAAHVDSPRLDLKQLPVYEDSHICYFKTHYYGGVKKYQWLTIPLELHGVIALKNGETLDICIGRDKADPIFQISDLLPHLAKDQRKKSSEEFVPGENLNLIAGTIPDSEEVGDRVKLAVMALLNRKYGIIEEDFLSAELSAVPAFETREAGLDRSLIAGYGHDDRVCAYAELAAIFETENPEKTAVCILADKEEIGSEGVTGMKSRAFERFMDALCDAQGAKLSDCFANSLCISADVVNAFDPVYPEVSEKRNAAQINCGISLCKVSGHGGKSGSSDASAELVARLRRIFADNAVVWQMAELGKVDQGGGGTVAVYMAERNIDTIDAGVPVLSMHAPCETVSKLDCYMTYKGIKAVYGEK